MDTRKDQDKGQRFENGGPTPKVKTCKHCPNLKGWESRGHARQASTGGDMAVIR